jgi:Rrf2 family protein
MLALTQTSSYAILAASCLNGPDGAFILAREIAACTGAPQPYLSKIFGSLSRAGLVEGRKGVHGGFRLRRPPRETSVSQVVEAVEGEGWDAQCLMGLEGCSNERACPLHEEWKRLREQIVERMGRTSLAEVVEYEHRAGRRENCPQASHVGMGADEAKKGVDA